MAPQNGMAIDAVVAADGSGDYTTVGAAVAAAPARSTRRHVIYVKKGLYKELINISADTWNLTLAGEGMDGTIISGNQSVDHGVKTIDTATISEHISFAFDTFFNCSFCTC